MTELMPTFKPNPADRKRDKEQLLAAAAVCSWEQQATRSNRSRSEVRERTGGEVPGLMIASPEPDAFGIHPVRAVLVETTDEARGRKLMELANHPLVCGPALPDRSLHALGDAANAPISPVQG